MGGGGNAGPNKKTAIKGAPPDRHQTSRVSHLSNVEVGRSATVGERSGHLSELGPLLGPGVLPEPWKQAHQNDV